MTVLPIRVSVYSDYFSASFYLPLSVSLSPSLSLSVSPSALSLCQYLFELRPLSLCQSPLSLSVPPPLSPSPLPISPCQSLPPLSVSPSPSLCQSPSFCQSLPSFPVSPAPLSVSSFPSLSVSLSPSPTSCIISNVSEHEIDRVALRIELFSLPFFYPSFSS